MAKITYDVGDVEEFEAYAGPTPKRGKYEAVIKSGEFTTSSNDNPMFKFLVVIDTKKKEHKQFNGCPLFPNFVIGDLTEDWMRRNLKAVVRLAGLKESGSLNTDTVIKKLTGKRVFVLVKNEMYNDEVVARANGLYEYKAEQDVDDEPDDDEDEDAEAAEDEDEEDEEVAEDEDEEDEEDEDEATVEDEVAELDRAGLRQYIKDNELQIRVTKTKTDDALRAEIIAAFSDDEEDEDEEADDEAPF